MWYFLENCPGRPLYNYKSFIHVQVNVIENLKHIAMSRVTHDLRRVNELTERLISCSLAARLFPVSVF